MLRIVAWIHGRSAGARAAIHALAAVLLFIVGAACENRVQLVWSANAEEKFRGLLWIVGLAVAAIIYGLSHYLFAVAVEHEAERQAVHQRAIQAARERLVSLHLDQLTACDGLIEDKGVVSVDAFRKALVCDQMRLDELIRIIWEIVNSHYNVSTIESERLNFEVTLITKSRLDANLTIAAWRNRQMTRPKSLVTREQSEPTIYDKTEAAKLMRAGKTETVIIGDTSDPRANYEQLYDDQKTRIRSSVLHPVTSPSRKQLGVLVLHCERRNFFREADQRYWQELFSVFAPAVALELERVDGYNRAAKDWVNPMAFPPYKPF